MIDQSIWLSCDRFDAVLRWSHAVLSIRLKLWWWWCVRNCVNLLHWQGVNFQCAILHSVRLNLFRFIRFRCVRRSCVSVVVGYLQKLLSLGGVSGRKQPMSGVVGWKSVTINCSVTGEEPKSSTNSNRSHTRSPHRSVCCQGWMPSLSWINPLTFWIKVLASTFRVMVLPLKVWTKIWNSWTNFVWFDFVEFRFD